MKIQTESFDASFLDFFICSLLKDNFWGATTFNTTTHSFMTVSKTIKMHHLTQRYCVLMLNVVCSGRSSCRIFNCYAECRYVECREA
jgi:hypothetical protein